MKNQFPATSPGLLSRYTPDVASCSDNRDLFKFDLAQTLVKSNTKQLNGIYYIPMLTPNDNKKHGGLTGRDKAKAGNKNKALVKYLDNCIRTGKRNIKEIKEYYRSVKIGIEIYREPPKQEKDRYFKHAKGEREEYFRQVNRELLANSLFLVDPDNGMEVDQSNDKHILFSELFAYYGSMTDNSILMIYQHFPRIEHREFIRRRLTSIRTNIVSKVKTHFISDNEITFFLLSKTPAMSKNVDKTIKV